MGKTLVDAPRLTAFSVDPDDLVVIGFDTEDGGEHPLYDISRIDRLKKEWADWESGKLSRLEILARDMLVRGCLANIVAVKNGVKSEVEIGRRRTLAGRIANILAKKEGLEKVSIPVVYRKGDDDVTKFENIVSENEQREDDDPLTKAQKANRLSQLGRADKDIAAVFGVNLMTVKYWAKVLETAPAVQKAVRDGRISATAASELASLEIHEQIAKLEELIASGKPTVESARRAAKASSKGLSGEDEQDARKGPPKKRVLRKLIEACDNGEVPVAKSATVTPDFLLGVKWVLGEVSTRKITGLAAIVKGFEPKKRAPKEEEADAE